jgi:peptidoglycan DL-endopeptidase CwlO
MNRRAITLVPIALVVVTVGALLAPTVATADPISDKQAEAAQLESQINTNADKLSTLDEQINSAQNELDQANAAIATADALVVAAQAKTKELRSEVAHRAAAIYTQSGTTSGVEELDSQNAQELSTRQKYSSLAAQRDKQIVNQLARAKEQVAIRKADAEKARQTAQEQRDAIQVQKDQLDAGQAELVKLQSKVTGELAVLVQKAEDERKAREAAEAQRQYDLQVANAAAADAANSSSGGSRISATPPPTSGSVGAVLAYAYAQLGKPYCYAGVGPGCFDCSGLTMMAWAQAGVIMSHGSYDQMASFPSVSMSQLQPGDLVFWDGHVGIYVGDGSVLHAPHSGTVVQITPIWPGVIGAVRPG